MINFRKIFNINYSYIGLIIIGIIIFILFLLDRKKGVKVIGYSFLVSGIFLLVVYLLGNFIVSGISYSFFIKVITDNFFSNVIVFSIISVVFGGISLGVYKYIS